MKKILSLILVLALCLTLFAGCGAKEEPTATPAPGAEATPAPEKLKVAFITDMGTVFDKSFNQSSWEGVKAWADANGAECKYYQPTSQDKTVLIDTMYNAIDDGYTVLCSAGFIFPAAISEVAAAEPDIKFVHLDGGFEAGAPANVASFAFSVEDAGWLAGYACVMDGYTDLAYVGGMALPSVYNAGQGFVQGADAAAKELGIDIDMQYGFTGNFDDSAANKAIFKAVLSKGSEVVFSFGGNNTLSAISAVNESANGAWIVYPDIDGSYISDLVYTSVMKELGTAVQYGLDDLTKNNGAKYFGKQTQGGIAEGMVGIPMATSQFESFDDAAYDKAVETLKGIDVIVSADAEVAGIAVADFESLLGLSNTNITFVK